eukprot:9737909-Prorocentrum_lima.AAC.1
MGRLLNTSARNTEMLFADLTTGAPAPVAAVPAPVVAAPAPVDAILAPMAAVLAPVAAWRS